MVRRMLVVVILLLSSDFAIPGVHAQVSDPRIVWEAQGAQQDQAEFDSSEAAPGTSRNLAAQYSPEELAQKLAVQPPNPVEDDGTPRGVPPNDLCANAILVTDGSYPFDTFGATSSGPTETICNFGFADGGAVNSDIWFVYQAIYTGHVTVNLCGSGYDTKLAAYHQVCPAAANTAVACDDDFCGSGLPSRIGIDVIENEFYLIRVGGYNGVQGSGTMVISSGPAPSNDNCADAIDMTCGTSIIANNSFATTGIDDPPFGCHDGGAALGRGSLWYRFVSPHGSVQIKTCNSPSATNTLVGLYDGESGCPLTLLNELGCGEDECGTGNLHTSICIGSIVPGRTYYIQVATFSDGARGQILLELNCPCPVGPDVIVGGLFGSGTSPASPGWNVVKNHGRVAGAQTTGYSVGTISCNPGNVPVQWVATSDKHPVIGQQLYRLKNGRFEQIGMSWVKHGFLALTENYCQLGCDIPSPNDGSTLGVGCSDPYNNDLNGTTTRLGPRGHINAFTGTFPFPFNTGVPFPPPGPPATIGRRLQVKDADLILAQNVDAKYYIEGHYITSDDATLGNGLNNASTREVIVTNSPPSNVYTLTMTGPDLQLKTGIDLWKINDPTVVETIIDVPNEGRFILSAKVTDLGNGTWNYEYAVYNYNSDRSGQYVKVPRPIGMALTNLGFHDVDYHSGDSLGYVSGAILNTDWTSSIGADFVQWETTTFASNPRSNALRWATLYNYRFDAAGSPTTGNFEIGLFKPGTPTSVIGQSLVPAAPVLVDINLAPSSQNTYVDEIIEVTMSLTAQGALNGPVSKVDAILNWDPALLEFVEYDITGAGYSWATHGFPVDPDGLNVSLADGRAMFEATAVSGTPATAPIGPGSLEVAKFRFRALALTAGTNVSMLPIEVLDQTQVIGAGTGDIRTGSLSSAATVVVVPTPPPIVDMHLSPAIQSRDMGETIEVTLSLNTLHPSGVSFTGVDAVLSWNPMYFALTDYDVSNAGYTWFMQGFLPNPDGLNDTFADGNAMFTVFANPGSPALAPMAPGTLEVAKFHFTAISGTEGTMLSFLPTIGNFSSTRVLGATAGSDVTGDIATQAEVIINGACSPTVGDVDGDLEYTFADIDAAVNVYLEVDTDPDHIIAADANCDGFADGADIQPLVDFLLLVL